MGHFREERAAFPEQARTGSATRRSFSGKHVSDHFCALKGRKRIDPGATRWPPFGDPSGGFPIPHSLG
jgi:hypothetical protein